MIILHSIYVSLIAAIGLICVFSKNVLSLTQGSKEGVFQYEAEAISNGPSTWSGSVPSESPPKLPSLVPRAGSLDSGQLEVHHLSLKPETSEVSYKVGHPYKLPSPRTWFSPRSRSSETDQVDYISLSTSTRALWISQAIHPILQHQPKISKVLKERSPRDVLLVHKSLSPQPPVETFQTDHRHFATIKQSPLPPPPPPAKTYRSAQPWFTNPSPKIFHVSHSTHPNQPPVITRISRESESVRHHIQSVSPKPLPPSGTFRPSGPPPSHLRLSQPTPDPADHRLSPTHRAVLLGLTLAVGGLMFALCLLNACAASPRCCPYAPGVLVDSDYSSSESLAYLRWTLAPRTRSERLARALTHAFMPLRAHAFYRPPRPSPNREGDGEGKGEGAHDNEGVEEGGGTHTRWQRRFGSTMRTAWLAGNCGLHWRNQSTFACQQPASRPKRGCYAGSPRQPRSRSSSRPSSAEGGSERGSRWRDLSLDAMRRRFGGLGLPRTLFAGPPGVSERWLMRRLERLERRQKRAERRAEQLHAREQGFIVRDRDRRFRRRDKENRKRERKLHAQRQRAAKALGSSLEPRPPSPAPRTSTAAAPAVPGPSSAPDDLVCPVLLSGFATRVPSADGSFSIYQ